jgi:hypothetical protein
VAAVGCLSPHPRRYLPGHVFHAYRLAQPGAKATASAGDGKSTGPRYHTIKGGYSVKVIKAIYNFIVKALHFLIKSQQVGVCL